MKSQVTLILVVLALGFVQAADKVNFAGTWKLKGKIEGFCGLKGDKIYTTISDKNLNLEFTTSSDCEKELANVKIIGSAVIPEEGTSVTYNTNVGTLIFTVIGDTATLKATGGLLNGVTVEFERSSGSSFIVIVLILVIIGVAGYIFVQKKKKDAELSRTLANNSKSYLNA